MSRSVNSVVDESFSTLPRAEEEAQRASYAAAERIVNLGIRLELEGS